MKSLKKVYRTFKRTCTPAQFYFILGLIGILGCLRLNVKLNMIILNAYVLLLVTFLLNMFSNKGWSKLSWFLVLFPYVMLLLGLFLSPFIVKEGFKKKKKK